MNASIPCLGFQIIPGYSFYLVGFGLTLHTRHSALIPTSLNPDSLFAFVCVSSVGALACVCATGSDIPINLNPEHLFAFILVFSVGDLV